MVGDAAWGPSGVADPIGGSVEGLESRPIRPHLGFRRRRREGDLRGGELGLRRLDPPAAQAPAAEDGGTRRLLSRCARGRRCGLSARWSRARDGAAAILARAEPASDAGDGVEGDDGGRCEGEGVGAAQETERRGSGDGCQANQTNQSGWARDQTAEIQSWRDDAEG